MDPSQNNWLYSCIKEISNELVVRKDYILQELRKFSTIHEFVHYYIHTTGMFYGLVQRQFIGYYPSAYLWNTTDNYKVSLFEGLLLCCLFQEKEIYAHAELPDDIIARAEKKIFSFYVLYSLQDSFYKKHKRLMQVNNQQINAVEKILDWRVNNPDMLQKEFWRGSQHNMFAYLDIVFFSFWLHSDFVYEKRKDIKKTMIKVMIAASYAEGKIIRSERMLVNYFLSSGNFDTADTRELSQCIKQGIDISQIANVEKYPYAMRRLLFETAIVSVLSDLSINEKEDEFLLDLACQLQIEQQHVQYSIVLIQNFLMLHNKSLMYLNYRFGYEIVTKNFSARFLNFLQKNSDKIISEISESKELLELLWKAKNEKLTPEEREKVKQQIFDIMRTLPSVAIFMVPGGSVLLPLLLKFLPEELLIPSSFRNKKSST